MAAVVGINNKQDQMEIASMFGVDEKHYSSLRQLLHVSIYVLKFIKSLELINVEKRKHFQKHKFQSINELKETSPIVSREIKLSSLLWVNIDNMENCY